MPELTEGQLFAMEEIQDFITSKRHREFLLTGYAGTGKLQPNSEPVLTPTGYVPMGEIKAGSLVIAGDGSVTKVLQVYPQSDLKIYRIGFSDGTWTECCEDHLWKVQTPKSKTLGKFKVMSLKEMLPKINNRETTRAGHYYSIPLCEPVQFFPQQVSIHPYLLGYLLGNGYLPQKGVVTVTTHKLDVKEVHGYLVRYSPQDVLFTLSDAAHLEGTNTGKINVSATIKPYLRELGLLGSTSRNKFVPPSYLYNSVYVRKQILAGLMDSDGSVYLKQEQDGGTKKINFSTTSIQLANDVIFLVQSLGGVCVKRIYNRARTGLDEINLSIRLPENPFVIKRKTDLFDSVHTYLYWTKKVVSAEYIGQKDGQCIAVQHPDQLYLTRGFTVTHNTTLITSLANLLDKQGYHYFLTAPTNKATMVLLSKLEEATESCKEGVTMTLHRCLGLKMVPDNSKGEYFLKRKKESPLIDHLKALQQQDETDKPLLIVVDEASMVANELYVFIKEVVSTYKQVKFLYVGDDAQLPPVEEESNLCHGLSKVFTTYKRFGLDEVVRHDGKILDLATKVRKNISESNLFPLLAEYEGEVSCVNSKDFLQLQLDHYSSLEFDNNPFGTRTVTWRNLVKDKYNRLIRAKKFGEDAPEYVEEEVLVAKDAVVVPTADPHKKKVIMQVSDECIIRDIEEQIFYYKEESFSGYLLTVEGENLPGELCLKVVSAESKPAFNEVLRKLAQIAKVEAKAGSSKAKKHWAEYYDLRETYANLDYAYALTTHKSQGSTFDKVFVDAVDILNPKHNLFNRNRSFYVAVSRAAKEVIIGV